MNKATHAGHLYHPLLTPERHVLADKEAYLASVRGTRSAVRWGEQYINTCDCGAVLVTSEASEVAVFEAKHRRGRGGGQ